MRQAPEAYGPRGHRVADRRKRTPDEQDEFLQAAYLFKYGPLLLTIGGLLLSAGFLVAGIFRIQASTVEANTAHFKLVKALAVATQESLYHTMGQFAQANTELAEQSLPLPLPAIARRFVQSPKFNAAAIDVVVLSAEGVELAATRTTTAPFTLPVGSVKTWFSKFPLLVLPRMASPVDGTAVIPVIGKFKAGPQGTVAVYFLKTSFLDSTADRFYPEAAPRLLIDGLDGARIYGALDTVAGTASPLFNSLEALNTTVDQAKGRYFAASVPGDLGFTITVALSADALNEGLVNRIYSTWVIVFIAAALVIILCLLTAYALKTFESKERHLRRLATIDVLTSLPNRRSFNQLMTKAIGNANAAGTRMSLLFIDLDNFKYINDSLGHFAGDELLVKAARVFQENVDPGNRVCRLGGDEFTVILESVADGAAAQAIGNRLIQCLATITEIAGFEVSLQASVGAVVRPSGDTGANELLHAADTAMHEAKRSGKSCCILFTTSMKEAASARARTIGELRKALANGELEPHYQPKFCLATGGRTGFEALVRWNHPERGAVSPAEFIPLAESAGLIDELGKQVLVKSVTQIKTWHAEGHGWQKVAVNVSALQLREPGFPQFVETVLLSQGVSGQHLQLELTESSMAHSVEVVKDTLTELRLFGVTIAVDDFGTGYSSLGALQQFELDYLKVDRSFVTAIHTPAGEEICRAVIAVGHALKLTIVAEGIEDASQCELLHNLGCDEVQGFLFAKPLPAAQAIQANTGPAHRPQPQYTSEKFSFYRENPRPNLAAISPTPI